MRTIDVVTHPVLNLPQDSTPLTSGDLVMYNLERELDQCIHEITHLSVHVVNQGQSIKLQASFRSLTQSVPALKDRTDQQLT